MREQAIGRCSYANISAFMSIDIYFLYACCVAYLLDLILGDPLWLPHPIVLFGKAISFLEHHFNNGLYRFIKGALVVTVLTGITWFVFTIIMSFAKSGNDLLYYSLIGLFLFMGLANRTLIKECKIVFAVLAKEGVVKGRKQLSRLVGRDTSELNQQQIKVAVLETMSENLSDGVVAPLFWFALGGIPGLMTYKMINTLDSMIGYKSVRYLKFGKVAARLDDFANLIPSRLTAFLMVLVTGSNRGLKSTLRYGHQHSSPNAGYPEAALAGILNVRFGGPNKYHGQIIQKPYIGNIERLILARDLNVTIYINHAVCLVMLCISIVIRFQLN